MVIEEEIRAPLYRICYSNPAHDVTIGGHSFSDRGGRIRRVA
jgi:hypothetical protein